MMFVLGLSDVLVQAAVFAALIVDRDVGFDFELFLVNLIKDHLSH